MCKPCTWRCVHTCEPCMHKHTLQQTWPLPPELLLPGNREAQASVDGTWLVRGPNQTEATCNGRHMSLIKKPADPGLSPSDGSSMHAPGLLVHKAPVKRAAASCQLRMQMPRDTPGTGKQGEPRSSCPREQGVWGGTRALPPVWGPDPATGAAPCSCPTSGLSSRPILSRGSCHLPRFLPSFHLNSPCHLLPAPSRDALPCPALLTAPDPLSRTLLALLLLSPHSDTCVPSPSPWHQATRKLLPPPASSITSPLLSVPPGTLWAHAMGQLLPW